MEPFLLVGINYLRPTILELECMDLMALGNLNHSAWALK